MKHLRKFNESTNDINLIDIIEDRFILNIADEYQLKEYSFDIFRKNGSTAVYKDNPPNTTTQIISSNYTQYNDGYYISRRSDGINIQLFFEMKSKMETDLDKVRYSFINEHPDIYKNLQIFIDGVYKITESLKMRLDWRWSIKEPRIWSEGCRDLKAYNISLYFTIDKEYKYESEDEKMEKIMKGIRDRYGSEEFDKKFPNWAPK
jgi:hypothetical protein